MSVSRNKIHRNALKINYILPRKCRWLTGAGTRQCSRCRGPWRPCCAAQHPDGHQVSADQWSCSSWKGKKCKIKCLILIPEPHTERRKLWLLIIVKDPGFYTSHITVTKTWIKEGSNSLKGKYFFENENRKIDKKNRWNTKILSKIWETERKKGYAHRWQYVSTTLLHGDLNTPPQVSQVSKKIIRTSNN